MSFISSDVAKAAELLSADDVVVIPTETVYGLAGNIFSENAIRKIFETKERPFFNPLIVHIASPQKLEEIAREIPEKAQQLADAFWPGSLTLVLKKQPNIPDLITAGKDTVAIRVPNHPVTLSLLSSIPFPLAAPSANPFGSISPTNAQHVAHYFEGKLRMVLDGGPCTNGIESTIIGFEGDQPIVYRLGAIAIEDIEKIVGPISVMNKKEKAPNAPGMLSRHYAPNTKTVLVDNVTAYLDTLDDVKVGVLLYDQSIDHLAVTHKEILSESGDLQEAGSKLYAALHSLDEKELDIIVAQRFPNTGLGKSINDRLERATK